MKVKLNIQKNGVSTLKSKFEENSNKDLVKFYMLTGSIKESGFDIIEEFLIDLKARKYFVIGIDKKYTTRRMLETFCKYTKNVYLFNNNYDVELDGNIFVFEYKDRALVITTCGTISDSSFETDMAYYTEIEYDFSNKKDLDEFDDYINVIQQSVKEEQYTKIDKTHIDKLVEDKEIFSTKQYTRNVLSIAELLNKKEGKNETNSDDTKIVDEERMPKVDLTKFEDVSFDIDIGDIESTIVEKDENYASKQEALLEFEELKEKEIDKSKLEEYEESIAEESIEVTEEFDGVLDVENMLFEKSDIKLNRTKISKKDENNDQPVSKKIDLEKVSNIIMELPKPSLKSKDSIKIPNYIKDMIPNFFSVLEQAKSKKVQAGTEKIANIDVEIIDVGTNEKYVDKQASLVQKPGQTFISFMSEELAKVSYDEQDIVRIIKLSNSSYHIEIVPKQADEYQIWQKLCTKTFRGTDRTFGIM